MQCKGSHSPTPKEFCFNKGPIKSLWSPDLNDHEKECKINRMKNIAMNGFVNWINLLKIISENSAWSKMVARQSKGIMMRKHAVLGTPRKDVYALFSLEIEEKILLTLPAANICFSGSRMKHRLSKKKNNTWALWKIDGISFWRSSYGNSRTNDTCFPYGFMSCGWLHTCRTHAKQHI